MTAPSGYCSCICETHRREQCVCFCQNHPEENHDALANAYRQAQAKGAGMTFAELLAALDAIMPPDYACHVERTRSVWAGETVLRLRWYAGTGDFALYAETPESLLAKVKAHLAAPVVDVAAAVDAARAEEVAA